MLRAVAALPLVLLATACASTPQAPSFIGRGEVQGRDYGATFTSREVISPVVQMSYQRDGRWVGRVGDTPISVDISEDRIAGPNVAVNVEDKGEEWRVRVAVHGATAIYALKKLQPPVEGGNGMLVLARTESTSTQQFVEVRVDRDAPIDRLPWPQTGLALLPMPQPH